MAITRAQIAKQLLEQGGRVGLQGGGADMGREIGPETGREPGEGLGLRPEMPVDRLRTSPAQEANQRSILREARVRAAENLINRPTFGFTDAAKFNLTPFPIKFLQDILGSGTGAPKSPMPGGGGGGIDTIPYWAQLGFNSEEEYLASLAAQENMKTDKIEGEDEGLRIAFRANGGRIGLQGGGADMGAPEKAQERADRGYGDTSGPVDMGSAQQNTNQMMQVMGGGIGETKLNKALNVASDLNFARDIIQGGGLKSIATSIGGPIAIAAILNKIRNSRRNQGVTLDDDDETQSFADGGPAGGIMDLESGRQMYFLGKLVKKATRAVKKIVKSPIGKAALFAGIGSYGLGLGPFKNMGYGAGFLKSGSPFMNKLFKEGTIGNGLTGGGMLALGTLLTAAPFAFQEDDQEDEYQKFLAQRGAGGQLPASIADIRKNYQDYMARAFVADGGRPEPVAKKTMPLLDMDGQEMDLRAEGGFVPIGRMEKADDVPARLSKNEFVFTADAVRNAGDGDVDKGAEVMYNMMKNLEAGGDVSEESQGMDGARKMFQTSQRLEEVL